MNHILHANFLVILLKFLSSIIHLIRYFLMAEFSTNVSAIFRYIIKFPGLKLKDLIKR